MTIPLRSDAKCVQLRESATLNPHPERVSDPLFQSYAFFDPRDLVQVRYEMLRRVNREGMPVKTAAAAFGFSRVTFYQVDKRFTTEGLRGLLPQPKGPRRAHKLSEAALQELLQILQNEPALLAADLQQRLFQRRGLWVHPRSIERALARDRKKDRPYEPNRLEMRWLPFVQRPYCCKSTRPYAARF